MSLKKGLLVVDDIINYHITRRWINNSLFSWFKIQQMYWILWISIDPKWPRKALCRIKNSDWTRANVRLQQSYSTYKWFFIITHITITQTNNNYNFTHKMTYVTIKQTNNKYKNKQKINQISINYHNLSNMIIYKSWIIYFIIII